MKVDATCAIPLFGSRVAPRCLFASSMLVVSVTEGEVHMSRTVSTENLDEYRWLEQLLDLEVDVIVCGGISPELSKLLNDYGIKVICNVAGEAEEVLHAFAEGRLQPWYGYGPKGAASTPKDRPQAVEAAATRSPSGRAWCNPFQVGSEGLSGATIGAAGYLAEVSLSPICSIEEIPEYLSNRDLKRVGLAYCSGMAEGAKRMADKLGRGVDVVAAACPADCHKPGPAGDRGNQPCEPEKQALMLNQAGCDLVIFMGFCPAFHAAFNRLSKAPSAVILSDGALEVYEKANRGNM